MAVKEISNDLFFTNIRNILDSGNRAELRVKGTSMHPSLLNGKHKVILAPYRKHYLKVGCIALFIYNGKYILHRLVCINKGRLIFQGDNLPYTREIIAEENIVAVVEFIIATDGKITDCRKRWFCIKNQLWQPISKYRLIFIRKTKGFLVNVFSHH